MMKKKRRAFTLVELIIVAVLVVILAAAAIPYGAKTLETGKWREARATLQAIYAAEGEFCLHNDRYAELGPPSVPPTLLSERYLKDPNDPDQKSWLYTLIVTPPAFVPPGGDCGTFEVTATRQGTGRNVGETVTIDQEGVLGGTFDPN
ncbi:MAG: prepilin-type N-terminal cleavage/methylation domain-containing protein [Candidatus Omnitrophica bacterium]|nr:prepilin-type N-terminal cleavage/methylation domain-containing protein [Candidatus Omnitrophota bacterium]